MIRGTSLPTLLKFGCIASLAFGSLSAGAQPNSLTDLGAGVGWGLNDSGQAILSTGLYSNQVITPLGMNGFAINASGDVAGETLVNEHAALYSNGTVTDLGVLPGNTQTDGNTEAFGINSSGRIVGLGLNGAHQIDAFSYSNGTMTDLHALPGASPEILASKALGVNDNGLIVGVSVSSANTTPATYDAFSYQNGTFTDLGPGTANAVNATGQITGALADNPAASQGNTSPTSGHAFLYANGATKDLGVLSGGTLSIGLALNATGQVVGSSNVSGANNSHAFFYNGVMTDLNSLIDPADPLKSNVILTEARGINATRLILVNGVDTRTQQTHAYLIQGPWLDIAPGALSFASQQIGTASSTQAITLTNSGAVPLSIGTISAAGDFSQTNDCGASLAAGGSCTVVVTFMPTAAGDRSGTITVAAAGSPFVVALSGVAPIDVTLSANPTSVTTGIPAILTWTQSPGASCLATGGAAGDGWSGSFLASGNKSVTEVTAGALQFGLMCTAGSQTATAQTSVTVTLAPVTVTLSATPNSITAGQSTTLTWSSSNATNCTATGGSTNDVWAGAKATAGSQSVVESSAATIQYALTCTAGAQTAQEQVTVTVTWPPVTVTISASPTTITAGQSTTLTWSATNATSCSATGGGSGDNWPGARAPMGTLDVTESSSGITASQTLVFDITCTSSQSGLSSEASVSVVENPLPPPPPPPAPTKSGGGAFDGTTLFLLLVLSCMNWLRRRFLAPACLTQR